LGGAAGRGRAMQHAVGSGFRSRAPGHSCQRRLSYCRVVPSRVRVDAVIATAAKQTAWQRGSVAWRRGGLRAMLALVGRVGRLVLAGAGAGSGRSGRGGGACGGGDWRPLWVQRAATSCRTCRTFAARPAALAAQVGATLAGLAGLAGREQGASRAHGRGQVELSGAVGEPVRAPVAEDGRMAVGLPEGASGQRARGCQGGWAASAGVPSQSCC
jgi:hypothetical protein